MEVYAKNASRAYREVIGFDKYIILVAVIRHMKIEKEEITIDRLEFTWQLKYHFVVIGSTRKANMNVSDCYKIYILDPILWDQSATICPDSGVL